MRLMLSFVQPWLLVPRLPNRFCAFVADFDVSNPAGSAVEEAYFWVTPPTA